MRELKYGEKYIYHTGYLVRDRGKLTNPLNVIAKEALALSDAGKIALTQRKIADGCYEYIATGIVKEIHQPFGESKCVQPA